MSNGEVTRLLSLGIAATERSDYRSALHTFNRVYLMAPYDQYPNGLSYYGLCLAQVEHQYKAGINWCQQAIQMEFYDGSHWANLVRLYMTAHSRRKAVATLEEGMKKLKKDPALMRVREEIGFRQTPAIPFLSRQNPINKLFCKGISAFRRTLDDLSSGSARMKQIAIASALVVYAGIVVAVFFMILD